VTLDEIRSEAGTFPTHVLEGARGAVCFFCAGFLGRNAEVHLLDAGLIALCVDSDAVKLAEMRDLYPPTWTFVDGDAYKLLDDIAGRKFDVVVVDAPLDDMPRCLSLLPQFRALGGRVVLGITCEMRIEAYKLGAIDIMSRTNSRETWWAVW
jgi:hypothetical protein